MKRQIYIFTLGLILCTFSTASYAVTQADINRAAATAIELQKQEQLRSEQDLKQLKERGGEATTIDVPFEKRDTKSKSTRCWTFTKINLANVTLLSDKEQQKIFDQYIGKCMTLADMNAILNDFTTLFFAKGYVTTRVYLAPGQDLTKGVLELIVIEGTLEDIKLEDGKKNDSVHLGLAFPRLIGKAFNLRDVEQGMEQINRLPSNNATIDIQPGAKPGASILLVKNAVKDRPFTYSLTHDNQGSKSTGRKQSSFSVYADNPMGLNDSFGLTARSTYPLGGTHKLSRSLTGNYSIAYGYSTFSFSGSSSDYTMRIPLSSGAEAKSSGGSLTLTGGVDHILYRNQTDKLTLSTNLSSKQNKNYLESSLIEVSSYNLTVLDVGVAYSTVLFGGSLSTGMGYVRGLDLFYAQKDLNTTTQRTPRAQFNKIRYRLNYTRPMDILGDQLLLSSALTAQYSNAVLYGEEQVSIGGLYSVRGYDGVSIAGDTGAYVRNTLTWTPQWVSRLLKGKGTISPYIAYDIGRVMNHFGSSHGIMSGVTYGAKVNLLSALQIDVNYSTPIAYPRALGDAKNRVFFNLAFRY